ncbi:MAG TPA: hypothetical protein VHE83_12995 [Mycobacteriales bacterium]|nr:hypothetical protein [Mycobacteriales bacterium]
MSAIGSFAPTPETMAYGQQRLPARRMTPGVVGGLDGPDGRLGPEHAGALTLVYGSFAEDAAAQRGYQRFTDAQAGALDAPGFLRWFSFVDGPHGYGLGLWRSAEDALAFARGPLHRELVREQRETPYEYSQFAGIYSAHTVSRRTFACPACRSTTAAPADRCGACGHPLDDGFAG